jgi:hypothetical protein
VISTTNVGIPAAPSLTAMNSVRTRAIGTTIKTWLNGKLIDKFAVNKWSDRHFHSGYVGVREAGGHSAFFDDFMLSRPPVRGFQVYLAESFNSPNSLSSFPSFARFRRSGVRISDTSCGGQPDDVAMLRAPNSAGYEYLFQSDRWDNGDQNEGQATQYWEPMKFNADGSLQGLTCAVTHTAVLSDAVLSSSPTVDGFTEVQDITSTHSRGQSFQVTAASNLTSVALTLFQTDVSGNAPNADLTVSLYDVVGANGVPTGSVPLAQATVAQSSISWSPSTVTVVLAAPLSPNTDGSPHQYAVVLSTSSSTGAYGVARADGTTGDQDPTGAGLVTGSDGSWTLEPTNDLRYALNVTTSTL